MAIATADIKETLFTLLTETFQSGQNPDGTMYLDRGAGLFDTLAPLSAEQASQEVIPGGTTLAAQVNHTHFYLEVIERYMRGEAPKVDWSESWQLQTVSENQWRDLSKKLKETYERISTLLQTQEDWEQLEDGFAIAIHTAYHLGAVRQVVKFIGGKHA